MVNLPVVILISEDLGSRAVSLTTVFIEAVTEMFYKKSALKNFRNDHGKTSVLESIVNKVAGLKACNFIKNSMEISVIIASNTSVFL